MTDEQKELLEKIRIADDDKVLAFHNDWVMLDYRRTEAILVVHLCEYKIKKLKIKQVASNAFDFFLKPVSKDNKRSGFNCNHCGASIDNLTLLVFELLIL